MTKIRSLVGVAVLAAAAALNAQEVTEGVKQYREQRYAEAENTLRGEADARSDNAEARAMVGRNLAALQRIDEGEAEIRRAQEMGLPEDRVNVALATAAIERRDAGRAMELLNRAIELNSNSAEAYHYRGMVKTQQKDFEGAIADLEKAVELDPSRAYTHYYLGLAYNGVKRPDQMARHLQEFLNMAPNAPDADKVRSVMKAFH